MTIGMRLAMDRSPRGGCQVFQRQAHQLLQLGPSRVGLVQGGGERRPLLGEERLGVEDVLAGGASGIELLLADAQVLLRLPDGGVRGVEGGETLGRRLARVTDRALQLAQLALDREPVAIGLDAGLGELRLAPAVRAQIPREAQVSVADGARLEDALAGPVDAAAALEIGRASCRER